MAKEIGIEDQAPASRSDAGVKRRGFFRLGTLITALTGASAVSAIGANNAQAASGKNPSQDYVPVAEKGAASGVATLDSGSKIPSAQLPDLSATLGTPINLAHPKYGVKGDGVTDDTAAIQSVLNLVTKGAGVPAISITAPAGTYRITNTLVIDRKAVKLIGAGVGNPTDHTNPGQGASFIWDGPAGIPMFCIKDAQAVVFEDFYLGGNTSTPPSELIYFENDGVSGQAGTNQHISMSRLTFGRLGYYTDTYPDHVTSTRCVRFGGTNANNDQAWFYDCAFGGAMDALVVLDNSNNLWCSFVNCVFDGRLSAADSTPKSVGLRTAASVSLYNPQFNRCSTDIDVTSGTTFAYMWNSENSGKFARVGNQAGLVVHGGAMVMHATMGPQMFEITSLGSLSQVSLQDIRMRTALSLWPKLYARGNTSDHDGHLTVRGCGIPYDAYDVAAGTGMGGVIVKIDDGPNYIRRRLRNGETLPMPARFPLRVVGYSTDTTALSDLLARLNEAGIIADRTLTARSVRINALVNPRFVENGAGWTLGSGIKPVTVGEALEMTLGAAINAGTSLAYNASAATASGGETWSAGVTVKVAGTATKQRVRAELKSYPGNKIIASADFDYAPGMEYRLNIDGAVVPAGETSLRLSLAPLSAAMPANAVVTVSRPLLEKSPVAGVQFHGSSEITAWKAAWTGTVDNSTSTLTPL
ncbi:hypothetical protein NtRootA9_28940 [Arthrobacter sp. NtRootA9]|nr:hypothetical protein NtRootA9_28940 [Arthrobacter sp. NtRootA9]